jgi:hypothetical protein
MRQTAHLIAATALVVALAAHGVIGCVAADSASYSEADAGDGTADTADTPANNGGGDADSDVAGDAVDDAQPDLAMDSGRDASEDPAEELGADTPQDLPPDLPEPDPVTCAYGAPNGAQGYKEVDTFRGNVASVRFRLEGLPDPATVSEVSLAYQGYDVDHPGAEGWIVVNGGAPIELPADEALDNAARMFALDVTGQTVAGVNTVEFLAFDTPDGSYYRISELRLDVTTRGPQECPGEPDPPTGDGVERIIHYKDAAASFTQRRNWVLDCRDYAYTARFDEHRECDSRYDPDGAGRGTATFTFTGVVPDRYTVWIEGRHTGNRNPSMMLVVVEGVERRINQRDEAGLVWDLHGEYDLAGDVAVLIDSTREEGSDSVRSVRITPVR